MDIKPQSLKKLADAFEGLSGVNYEDGIRRVSGNADLYTELLHLFFNDDGMAKLIYALENNDKEGARQEAHSLKGTAANLGLTSLSKLAATLYSALRDSDTIPAQAMELTQNLNAEYRFTQTIVDRL